MTPSATTFVTIKEGKLYVQKRDEYIVACKMLPEGDYKWSLERIYNKRTLKQNAANFGVIYSAIQPVLSDALGEYIPIASNSDDDATVHNICKARCLPKAYIERLKEEWEQSGLYDHNTGELIYKAPFRLTTTKMTTVEMSEYWQNIQAWALEYFGAELPDPVKQI